MAGASVPQRERRRPRGAAARPFFRCPTGGGYSIHNYQDGPAGGGAAAAAAADASALLLDAIHHAILHADNGAARFVLRRGQVRKTPS